MTTLDVTREALEAAAKSHHHFECDPCICHVGLARLALSLMDEPISDEYTDEDRNAVITTRAAKLGVRWPR